MTSAGPNSAPVLAVLGNGMVGHRFVEEAVARELPQRYRMVVLGEEPRPAYDRVHLSEYFAGRSAAALGLASASWYAERGVELRLGVRATSIDRAARTLACSDGTRITYDKLVLATGSSAWVPAIGGVELAGCFVYRTVEDLEAIGEFATGCRSAAVIGGGLLGLEAANALRYMGLATHVVELAPQLMAVQLDAAAGSLLRGKIEALGVTVHTAALTTRIDGEPSGPRTLHFANGEELSVDMVVFSAGIRPRDELARSAGLTIGPRGGVAIDDACTTSDASIYAVGEVACWKERCYGLVGPGYRMAAAAAADLAGEPEPRFAGADLGTSLKLLGVDVASFGDSHGAAPGSRSYSWTDEVAGIYKRLVVSGDGKVLLGGILVGDAADYMQLQGMAAARVVLPEHPERLILSDPRASAGPASGAENLSDAALVCTCNSVSKGGLCEAIRAGAATIGAIKASTKAGTGCGGCVPLVTSLLRAELIAMGRAVDRSLCEHFAFSRKELEHVVRSSGIRDFATLIRDRGRAGSHGCEICKPVAASIFASTWNEHVLDAPLVGLQDSNDHFLANIQKDGSYSVVPRVPGGEITPDQLIAIGRVAKHYDLYTKITGGQRIDLFGAKAHQLPAIWRELIDAGFESGHAYGKAVRTVKSCVGSTWCRFGQQDSVGLAIRLEHRYKGIRAPHKLKLAVSGCTRECAEAQGKDVGVIATERGYNLYVCGNGGMRPRHADLFAVDLDEETLIRTIDRFLVFYIRTADRLQRTSVWLENLEGGLDYLKQVILQDSLGIAADLERQMQALVDGYQCEWLATVQDPRKCDRFRTFVNDDAEDPAQVYVRERDQRRPADSSESRPDAA